MRIDHRPTRRLRAHSACIQPIITLAFLLRLKSTYTSVCRFLLLSSRKTSDLNQCSLQKQQLYCHFHCKPQHCFCSFGYIHFATPPNKEFLSSYFPCALHYVFRITTALQDLPSFEPHLQAILSALFTTT